MAKLFACYFNVPIKNFFFFFLNSQAGEVSAEPHCPSLAALVLSLPYRTGLITSVFYFRAPSLRLVFLVHLK